MKSPKCPNCGSQDLIMDDSEYDGGVEFNNKMTSMTTRSVCDNCGSEMTEHWDIKYIKTKITKINNYHKE